MSTIIEIANSPHEGIGAQAGTFRKAIDINVEHIYTKTVDSAVLYKSGLLIATGQIAVKGQNKGIVFELRDARIIEDFIGIWWPSEVELRWYSMLQLFTEEITLDGRSLRPPRDKQ